MNSTHTMPRLPAAAPRDSFPRRSARLLLRGPASLTSPLARWAVTLLAVAGAAATAAGLLLSAGVGLFGYVESLAVPYAEASLVVEFTSAAVLAFAAAIVLAAPRLSRRS
jgi:hypothetical protein